ncbi:uncharacterized protein Hmr [Drosophila takahashii]|uniref:uncharacterized protein Hmr n=1 Tax=Drosophila takahashii TaxID=29030 RepID=UPI001CF8A3B0|nr:uncharacterized protein LOC108060911 [Drosophila takahashii]
MEQEEIMAPGEAPEDPLVIEAENSKLKGEKPANPFSRTTYPGSLAGEAQILQSAQVERRLIVLVRRHPALYDARHPKFHDDLQREKVWLSIASRLSTDLTNCLVAWAELRYRYQRHVRRLRAFHRQGSTGGHRRPRMRHEEELLFLYPHVARFPLTVERLQPSCEVIKEPAEADVEIVEPPPVDIIDVDLEEESLRHYRCSKDQRRLIEAVQAYPQLYDNQAPGYENTRHRGLIWGAIANELHDKATKLMKSWLKLQTRYEWELAHQCSSSSSSSELCQLMHFLQPHLQRMPGTVCKASKYLQTDWHEPIEHFRSVMSLINTMRNMPELVQMTDDSMSSPVMPPRYDELWQKVGAEVIAAHQRCEVTWLVLRSFHHELCAMRMAGYQLQDKWYFENALSSIFKQTAASRATIRPVSHKRKNNGAISGEPAAKIQAPPRLPLAIVYPPAPKTISNSTTTNGTTLPTITNVRSCSNAPATPETAVPAFVIPKITSAMSVATPNLLPLKLPPTLRIAPKAAAAMGMNLAPNIPANIQLASPAAVRPSLPQRPGLQVSLQPKPNPPQMPPAASRSLIRPKVSVGLPVQRYPTSSALGALLSEAPLPQIPHIPNIPHIPATVTPQQLPHLVPLMPGNSPSNPGTPGAPMVRIHQPAMPSGWDAAPTAAALSKPTATTATAAATISVSSLTATTKWSAAPAGGECAKKQGQMGAQSAVSVIRQSKSVGESQPPATSLPAAATLNAGATLRTGEATLNAGATLRTGEATINTGATSKTAEATLNTGATSKTGEATINTGATISLRRTSATSAKSAVPAKPATLPTTAAKPGATATPLAATAATTANVDTTEAEKVPETTKSTVSSPKTIPNAKTGPNTMAANAAAAISHPEATTNSNQSKDVTVFFQKNAASGNMLLIFCDNQATRYNLNMVRTATLVREVMAVPQLHKKDPQLAAKCDEVWKVIGKKFHMPEEALRACWQFLADNMSVFPLIAPMSELMRPFKASVKVWEKSHRLFSKFDEIARKYLWMEHKEVLPDVIRHFRQHEHLYWEMHKPRPGEEAPAPPQYTDQERLEVWREARVKFPNLNHRDIWSMFKFAFRTYMEDLERGIENPWPQNWWQALEQLRFLAYVRYHPLEPYYYIVHNKISEEVKRCSMYEALMSADPADKSKPTPTSLLARLQKEPMPWETEEAKRLLTGQLSNSAPSAAPPAALSATPAAPPAAPTSVPEVEPTPKKPSAVKNTATKQTTPTAQKQIQIAPQTSRNLPTIEAFELTHVLRRHPHTFERASTIDKRTAWVRVSKELNATVTECRLGLQYALREMRVLKITDPTHRCTMGHKYLRHMTEIYKQVKPNGQLTIRTPQQLNQSLAEPAQEVVPQRFVPEINLTTCSPNLVLKNWAHAVGNLSHASQDSLLVKLTQLFSKYAEEANVSWVYPAPP